ncbi:MAG: glutathione peroxidase [Polaromonas sp. 39-63-203]|jgi:glutaredoxin-like protein|uniref:glutathione peroxidase n=1 Tax=Polaromonas sp. TaxID=1869339 RepID=UPI000BD0C4CC|nr:glutathione peroxidase [Polaromonas sp.]OYY52151.1 MAG: glutathione peroxidase [Polaromonas sp. 35-63-240]OYY96381.1 MAG: glutathione peroxidase [Polaromonas sp. 28-63-22]OYZ83721.1 MAG: glutathione peroxidase [Polaromonas sp. 24-62-144]OZA98001.1 MAG: glutathione peroxidase [Polaromonas sp. 39-63-203]HQS30829.1 glutathione peroxidase [Polaromonas sp.]
MLPNKEGQRVPDVTFKTRQGEDWVDVTTSDLFDGKKVVVFSLPGAYTPTCSSTHLPRFNELAATFKANGIDDVVCMSVNDPFVMSEWGKAQEAESLTLIPDGNGKFSEGMGLLVDMSDLGFGKRSWRYSMLVNDGKIEKMFIEPEKEGDPFEVSDADTMLKYVAPKATAPEPVTIFTKPGCPFCAKAKAMLQGAGLTFEEISLVHGVTSRSLQAVAGEGTAPQVFAGGKKIGGSEALQAWLAGRKA